MAEKIGVKERTIKCYLNQMYLQYNITVRCKRTALAVLLQRTLEFKPLKTTVYVTTALLRTLELVPTGISNRQIAKTLFTSDYAIKARLRRIFEVTGMSTRTELALWYVSHFWE